AFILAHQIGIGLPTVNDVVEAGANQLLIIVGVGKSRYAAIVSQELVALLSGLEVPHDDSSVGIAAGQGLAAGRKCKRPHLTRMTRQGFLLDPSGWIPELDVAIVAAAGECFSIA